MMKVLYFAHIKHQLNKENESFDLDTLTVADFKTFLYETYPNIQQESFQVAVNEEFVQDSDLIQPEDIVALIPPVSGG